MAVASADAGNSSSQRSSPERDALERILCSDFLNRAPNLILFLRYVCEMQLAGRTEAIKEYNVAVEALGRGGDFDQKKDSIVRVEAHRLRKRLAEYYKTVGADDPVEIVLPAGTYVPEFRSRHTAVPPPAAEPAEPAKTNLPGFAALPKRLRRWAVPGGMLVAAATALVVLATWKSDRSNASTIVQSEASRVYGTPPVPPIGVIRILAGGARDGIPDHFGQLWGMDRFASGGEIVASPARQIRRTPDGARYLTRREGEFEYQVPVPAGTYELRLHFAETVFGDENVAGGGESSRIFEVTVNGGAVWTADIISEASGPNTATVRVYRGVSPGADGMIRIAFGAARKEAAFVNAIEILPAPDGKLLPVRIVAGVSAVRDTAGQEWGADRFWLGGQPIQRHEKIEGPEESGIYQGERYGNFSYALPVATDSTYTLILRFAETWFGQGRPGGGGPGTRVFDVYCNGRVLLRNFDVLKEAGRPMRQLKKVFRGLEPNAQGKLNLQFVPVRNYAMINAIEVVDEGP